MTPFELWQSRFPGIDPEVFWRRSRDEGFCQQADEAVDAALAGLGPFFLQWDEPAEVEEAEALSEFLAWCVPDLEQNETRRR